MCALVSKIVCLLCAAGRKLEDLGDAESDAESAETAETGTEAVEQPEKVWAPYQKQLERIESGTYGATRR